MEATKNTERIVGYIFLAAGLAVQVLVYCLHPDNIWSLVSGLLGMCSVVLCSQGNILTFAFGFGQILTYSYLCYLERFYAGLALNVFYFLTQIYGVYSWRKQLHTSTQYDISTTVPTRSLSLPVLSIVIVLSLLISFVVGFCLSQFTADGSPYLDAFTTIPALVAQVLMILVYREQWYLWLFVDSLSVLMWLLAGNYCMAALYFFWCVNCIYGYVHWTKHLAA